MKTILCLNESRLPKPFADTSIIGKEATLRSALKDIGQIILLSLPPTQNTLTPKAIFGNIDPKIKVIHTPPWPYYLSTIILFIIGFKLILKYRPDWLEAESPIYSGPAAIWLAKIFHLPILVEIRSDFLDLAKFRFSWLPLSLKKYTLKTIQNFTLKHTTGIIANSHTYARQFSLPSRTLTVINPGIRLPLPSTPKFIIHPSKFTLGYLGRLVPEKGVHLLIQAVNLLAKKTAGVPFLLLIAGTGPEKSRLENLVQQLHLNSLVKFVGFQPSFTFLNRCHILINPCLVNAPLEMVNAEAAATGVPVICFGQNTYPETVIHHVTGLKVHPPTPAALAAAINTLMSNFKLRLSLHQSGPSFVAKSYSFDMQVNQLYQFYRRLRLL